MTKRSELGQSILEVVFSIGVIALVVTSSVFLIINSVGLKNKNLTRKKASEVANLVVEDVVSEERNNRDEFWVKVDAGQEEEGSRNDFNYRVVYSGVEGNGCTTSTCANAVIIVNWGDVEDLESLEVTRFFYR